MFETLFFRRLFLSLLLTITTINAYSANTPGKASLDTSLFSKNFSEKKGIETRESLNRPENYKIEHICTKENFQDFFSYFMTSLEIQKKFSKYPLKYTEIIDQTAEPVPKINERKIKKKDIKSNIITNDIELKLTIKKENANHISVIETSSGKKYFGHYISYHFLFLDKCWKLVEINNLST
jgi:hypothetical protein